MSTEARELEIYVAASPAAAWQAVTDPEQTSQYWFGARSFSEWRRGATWRSESADGDLYLEGRIVEIDPPHRLVHTFRVVHDVDAASEPPSRVTWEMTASGGLTRLRLIHDGIGPRTAVYTAGGGGWAYILSGLKTLLETGRPMAPGPGPGA